MKRMPAFLLSAALIAGLSIPAFADDSIQITTESGLISANEYDNLSPLRPVDIEYSSLNGNPVIIKRYETSEIVSPSVFPYEIEQSETKYQMVEILEKQSAGEVEAKTVQEIVSLSLDTSNKAAVLSLLAASMDYDIDGFTGQLYLDPASIETSVAKTASYSYDVSTQREYSNLDRKDTAYIMKTVQESGRTLQLDHIDWTSYNAAYLNNGYLPSAYTAVATYAGKATGSRPSEYTATALYTGEVRKEIPGAYTYSVIYEAVPQDVFLSPMAVTALILLCVFIGVACVVVYNIYVRRAMQKARRRWKC